MKEWINKLRINESINQWINKSMNQWINEYTCTVKAEAVSTSTFH